MTLYELQEILGERILIHSNDTMSDEVRKRELENTDIIARVAKQMINNADVILRQDKLIAEGKLLDSTIVKVVSNGE